MPPDLISCHLGHGKLIRFEQVHCTLRESQAPMQPGLEQLHPPSVDVGSLLRGALSKKGECN